MKSILRALALTGILGLGAAAAQAQVSFSVGVGGPALVAVPPCPGAGYVWTSGYYYGRVWVPGRWVYEGYAGSPYVATYGSNYGRVEARGYDRNDRRDFDRDRDRDRGRDARGHDDFHRR